MVDANGVTRLMMMSNVDGSSFSLKDKQGKHRLTIYDEGEKPGLATWDSKNRTEFLQ